MDKLAEQLKSDAGQIDVTISDELERRIDASLQGISPEPDATTRSALEPKKCLKEIKRSPASHSANTLFRLKGGNGKAGLWWASLTGATAALLIIAFANFSTRPDAVPDYGPPTSPVAERPNIPIIEWKTQSAMLTSPLRKELEDLQSDVRKAEQIVRREIGL